MKWWGVVSRFVATHFSWCVNWEIWNQWMLLLCMDMVSPIPWQRDSREYFELAFSLGRARWFKPCQRHPLSLSLQGSKNLFCASRRIFRAEPGCHFSGRILFHLDRNRAPRLKSLGAKKKEAIFDASFCTPPPPPPRQTQTSSIKWWQVPFFFCNENR